MRFGTRVGTVVAVMVAAVAGSARAAIVTLNPSKDNTLIEDATGSLSDAKGDGLFAGRIGTGGIRRAVMAFDLSTIPAGMTITSATLSLNVSRTTSAASTIAAHRLTKNWGEGTSISTGGSGGGGAGGAASPGDATWINTFYNTGTWTNPGGDFSATVSGTGLAALGAFTVSGAGLAADVQAWYANPSTNFGWVLIGDEGAAAFGSAKRIDSRESSNVAARPVLTVEYAPVPEPGTGAVVMMGAGALGVRRRRAGRR